MNSSADTTPLFGWSHLSNASTPMTAHRAAIVAAARDAFAEREYANTTIREIVLVSYSVDRRDARLNPQLPSRQGSRDAQIGHRM
jgi:hypothetical protein